MGSERTRQLCLVPRALNGSLRPGVPDNRTVRTRPRRCQSARRPHFSHSRTRSVTSDWTSCATRALLCSTSLRPSVSDNWYAATLVSAARAMRGLQSVHAPELTGGVELTETAMTHEEQPDFQSSPETDELGKARQRKAPRLGKSKTAVSASKEGDSARPVDAKGKVVVPAESKTELVLKH